MSNLINKIWFVFLSVCLAITIGTAFGAVSSGPGSAEEVCSLEIVEVEAAEKLLNRQRRRTNESTGRNRLSAILSPRSVLITAGSFSCRVLRTERCQLNGFGGYLRT